MAKNSSVPITRDFNHNEKVLGQCEINVDVLPKDIENYVLAPGYIKNDDGSIELLEISLIHVKNAKKSRRIQ